MDPVLLHFSALLSVLEYTSSYRDQAMDSLAVERDGSVLN